MTTKEIVQDNSLTPEDYSNAMNTIGQSLLNTLIETISHLPQAMRNNEMAIQGMAAFLGNAIYKQFPEDQEARQKTFERLMTLVSMHIANIDQYSPISTEIN